jgi:hypothetical protein
MVHRLNRPRCCVRQIGTEILEAVEVHGIDAGLSKVLSRGLRHRFAGLGGDLYIIGRIRLALVKLAETQVLFPSVDLLGRISLVWLGLQAQRLVL